MTEDKKPMNAKIVFAENMRDSFKNKLVEREVDLSFWKAKEISAIDAPQFTMDGKPAPSERASVKMEIDRAILDIANLKLMVRCWEDKLEDLYSEGVKKAN